MTQGTTSAYERALRRLSRREQTEAELRRALSRAGHEEDEVEAALRRLRGQGFLDDAALAGRFARSRLANLGHGRYRIREALRVRGVAPPTVEEGVRAALSEVPEGEALDAVAKRYWGQRSSVEPRERLRKLTGVLLRRGFPAALVRERLQALWPDWAGEVLDEAGGDWPDGDGLESGDKVLHDE